MPKVWIFLSNTYEIIKWIKESLYLLAYSTVSFDTDVQYRLLDGHVAEFKNGITQNI